MIPRASCRNSTLRQLLGAGLAALYCAGVSAAEGFDYPGNLREVYGAYQGVLARREACASAYPQWSGAAGPAYTAWRGRHRKLIEELDQRLAMMIRGASKDDKDYARNIGKYEGAILLSREEAKTALLQQLPSDLEAMCKALPEFLHSAASDLEKAYAEELAIVRKRPLGAR